MYRAYLVLLYVSGHYHIVTLDFDFVEFHDTILTGGPRPLSILEEDIARWYTAKIRK